MEIKLRNRSRLMLAFTLLAFLLLVYAYAQLELRLPQAFAVSAAVTRGSILAANGNVLAKTVAGRRIYPQGEVGGQLIGFLGTDRGLEGVEAEYQDRLARGEPVTLTIDPKFQAVAESVLARAVKERRGEYGSVVALDVRSGRVLAAASYPPFNPNDWRQYGQASRRNRPFLDVFEPGSTVKGLVVAAALNEGLITPSTTYETPMRRAIGRNTIHDVVPHPGVLNTQQVLRYSSNVGMSHVVEHFEPQRMYGYLEAYGFGRAVDLPTVYTETGQLQPWRRWSDIVRATNAFGQGMSGTPLQLAAAYNTLANDGVYVAPQLVLGEPAGPSRRVVTPQSARRVRAMLRAAIDEQLPHAAGIPGYSLAGKTGTAQVAQNGGYSSTLYDSVFAGFIPAEQPRVTLAVMVHGAREGYHGAMLAAPIYRDIAAELFSQWAYPPNSHK